MTRRPRTDLDGEVDVVVVGSGFGGSVMALRLAEKGYRVAVLEEGRRWEADTLPRSSWDLRHYLWMPKLGCFGPQRLTLLRHAFVLNGAAVGGGSVVYANTLVEPDPALYRHPQWRDITDWQRELAPHLEQATRMLGVTTTPFATSADVLLRDAAEARGGVAGPTEVGVWFGDPGVRVADPYFGGAGPDRTGCIRCGGCMVGCRHGAKNSLDRNYLHLAALAGATVHAEHRVVDLRRRGDRWEVHVRRPGWGFSRRRVVLAEHVVVAAGALGTARLLADLRRHDRLPGLSDRLGALTRTNAEAIVGVAVDRPGEDLSLGLAIGSKAKLPDGTLLEPVRYPKGSNLLGLLATVLVDGGGSRPARAGRFLRTVLRHPRTFLRAFDVRRWSERTVLLLAMQAQEEELTFVPGRRRGVRSTVATGREQPPWSPLPHAVVRDMARAVGGTPRGSLTDALLGIPVTAHLVGGCVVGATPATGVVDAYHRAFGVPGLSVVDGSTLPGNLGANPSLTITALAERAAALWPNHGDDDLRPPVGQPYRRLAPIAPRSPAVPADAPGALTVTRPTS